MRMMGIATVRKRALTLDDLGTVIQHYHNSTKHDDLLFVAMILTGFFALMCLGELTSRTTQICGIGRRSYAGIQLYCRLNNTSFTSPLTRQTDILRETGSSFEHNNFVITLSFTFRCISHHATTYTHSLHLCGSQNQEPSPLEHFSSAVFGRSLGRTLLASQCVPEVQHHWPKMEFLLQ